MKVLSFILLLTGVLLNVGWFFFRRPAVPAGGWVGVANHEQTVTHVRFVARDAVSAAAAVESDYRADGWTSAPVCTPTFKLFSKGKGLAAVLAEDAPGGAWLTEFRALNTL